MCKCNNCNCNSPGFTQEEIDDILNQELLGCSNSHVGDIKLRYRPLNPANEDCCPECNCEDEYTKFWEEEEWEP